MKNNFTEETRSIFIFETTCWKCNRPNPELHHILGRVNDSPLNAYPLCRKCHSKHIEMISEENKKKFLNETIRFLLANNYMFKMKDYLFYIKNEKYYEKKV